MSKFADAPMLYADFLAAEKFTVDVVGSAISGGRDINGQSVSTELSGGGALVATFERCNCFEPEQQEYINMLAARLNGSHRYINVPVMSDFMGPFGGQSPMIGGIPHSDGALFSDGSGYSQGRVFGQIVEDAALNAGKLVMDVFGAARNLRWSDWFSIFHPVKGWRAYRYWERTDPEDVTATISGYEYTGKRYTLALSPPLREATPAGKRVEFARPRFVAKFPTDFTLPYSVEGTYRSVADLRFEEAMGG